MTLPASNDAEPTEPRHRRGARWHAGLSLVAVVLAYLGIALGAVHLGPSAPTAGLSAADAVSHRPHLVARERGPAAITQRVSDPPRADRPVAATVGRSPLALAAGPTLSGVARTTAAPAAAPARAHLPRGPPSLVRSAAA